MQIRVSVAKLQIKYENAACLQKRFYMVGVGCMILNFNEQIN